MIVTIAVVGGILGLATLLMPRSLMLFGERWRLKDGDTAEPSDVYVIYVRVIGVVILIATAAFTTWLVYNEHAQARAAELEELWEVQLYPGDEIAVMADPRVVTSRALGARQVVLSPTRTAVIGRDELGDLGDISSFDEGDLLVGMGYSTCTFSHLIVTRDGGETVVGIVVELPEVPLLPGMPPVGGSPDVDSTPSTLDTLQDIQFCTRRFGSDDVTVGLTVFHVPVGR